MYLILCYFLFYRKLTQSVLSSVGRMLVSKTKCRGFKSFRTCLILLSLKLPLKKSLVKFKLNY